MMRWVIKVLRLQVAEQLVDAFQCMSLRLRKVKVDDDSRDPIESCKKAEEFVSHVGECDRRELSEDQVDRPVRER